MAQQLVSRSQSPQHRIFTGTLFTGGGDCCKQHHQARRQGKGKQKLHRTNHLSQYFLNLVDGGTHVHIGDIGKLVDQGIVKARLRGCAVGGDIGHGYVWHGRDRVDGKEIGTHRRPIHPPYGGHAHIHHHARHVKAQLVAQLELQGFGNALFHADGVGFFWLPSALHDLVVRRCFGRVGDIELPLNQALCPLVGVALGSHVFTIDLNQPPPHHGVPVQLGNSYVFQVL